MSDLFPTPLPLVEVSMSAGPVFFTLARDGNGGAANPRSVLVVEALQRRILEVEALQKRGCSAVVLDSPRLVVPATVVVALFDVNFGVNRWSPRPNNAARTPSWARELSSACVAVGERCVAFPTIIEGAAAQIAALFLRDCHMRKGEYLWGPAPTRNRSGRRERDTLRYRAWVPQSHLSRR